ncbi:hypothetical protein GUITHDRAFT_110709 [Guillardia theta CCMP2712]|uniref:Uncharacterized protein n=1 Tax=Guillardia theta (strain CCMP2712) TaxID=905079 RepID=L1J5C1_GUITC|nr:hypothetical protein GUITHDRAFT_110709 [Guillardia theta CCMP2712]EKX43294.1 hypothetical protein GUITHDRAFT_110709 [Guillardia theta CCMP2712]|eukprot:XP_005830274.1 hypothetical protein GUITHDRAFT_110709 [Guillardia theta CCMP2712]
MNIYKTKRDSDPLRRRPKSASLHASGGEHKSLRPISAGARIWSGGWVFSRHRCLFGDMQVKTPREVDEAALKAREKPRAPGIPADKKSVRPRPWLRPQTAPLGGKSLEGDQPRRAASATKRVSYAFSDPDKSSQEQKTLTVEVEDATDLSLSLNGKTTREDLDIAPDVVETVETTKSNVISFDDLETKSKQPSLLMKKSFTLNDLVRKTRNVMSARKLISDKPQSTSPRDHYGEEAPHAWYCKICGQNGSKVKWCVWEASIPHRHSQTSYDNIFVGGQLSYGKTPRAIRRYEQMELNKSPWKLPVDESSLLDTPNVNKETVSLVNAHMRVMHNNVVSTKTMKGKFLEEGDLDGAPQEKDEEKKDDIVELESSQSEWDNIVRTPSVATDILGDTTDLKDFSRSSVTVIARVTTVMKRLRVKFLWCLVCCLT